MLKSLKFVGFLLFTSLFIVSGDAQSESFVMTQLGPINYLNKPWDLNWGPDGFLWVTERENGGVLRIDPESALKDELLVIPDLYSSASQDGLLGMAIHEGLLEDQPYVYLSYSYLLNEQRRQKIVRYTYTNEAGDGALNDPQILIDKLPSSNDHNSGRLVFGPDAKLYYTIGDQGGNQNRNFCNPILSQVLPTQAEIDENNWSNYPGKILRLNLDGSIPEDNPSFEGVKSHIYTIGHRNAQGLIFASNGMLYSNEHGPNTDDEVNRIEAGGNYGWPNVVGFQDDQAYDYCNWSAAPNCANLSYSNGSCPAGAPLVEESSFQSDNYQEPLFSLFAVTDDYNYNDPRCENAWICRPNVAPSSLSIYESNAIPAWQNSLLVTSLKRGRVYRLKLDETGTQVIGDTIHHFYTQNRYRDMVVAPDGKSFYIITDQQGGRTSDVSGLNSTRTLRNPGSILKFTLQEVVSSVSLEEQVDIQVWPNPSANQLYIQLDGISETNLKAELISLSGTKLPMNLKLQAGINQTNIGHLPAGMYILKINSDKHSWQKRIVLH